MYISAVSPHLILFNSGECHYRMIATSVGPIANGCTDRGRPWSTVQSTADTDDRIDRGRPWSANRPPVVDRGSASARYQKQCCNRIK
jgi:hypothetical protein